MDSGPRPWVARVRINGETFWLGYYSTKETAAKVEDQFKHDLRRITEEAHTMWYKQMVFLTAVAKVREGANA